MGISESQAKAILDKALKDSFKKGVIPNIEELTKRVQQQTKGLSLGGPLFNNVPLAYRDKTSIDVFNDQATGLYTDLETLYSEVINTTLQVIDNFDVVDASRRSLDKTIGVLEKDIDQLTNSMNSKDTTNIIYDLDSVVGIDLESTTAIVDTEHGVAVLPTRSNGKILNLSHLAKKDTIEFKVTPDNIVVSNTLAGGSRFGDGIDGLLTSWKQQIKTNAAKEVTGEFTIEVNKEGKIVEFNRVNMIGDFPNPTYVELLYSKDEVTFISLGEYQVKDAYSWIFSDVDAAYLKFKFRKSEPEASVHEEDFVSFLYEFGIRSLSIIDETFVDKCSITTDEVNITTVSAIDGSVFDKIAINSNHEGLVEYYILPIPDTDVYPSGVSIEDWVKVPEDAYLDLRSTDTYEIDASGWLGGITPSGSINGISIYKVGNINQEYISNNIEVHRGIDNWQKVHNTDETIELIEDEEYTFSSAEGSSITIDASRDLVYGSVVIRNMPGGLSGDDLEKEYKLTRDYTIEYATGVVTKTPTSSIDTYSTSGTVYVTYSYEYDKVFSPTYIYTTYIKVGNPEGITINLNPAVIDKENEEFARVTIGKNTISLDNNYKLNIPKGTHKVMIGMDSASPSDTFDGLFTDGPLSEQVTEMQAYSPNQSMKLTSKFNLEYNTIPYTRNKFYVEDLGVFVNFAPDNGDLLLENEIFDIKYKTSLPTAISKIRVKAIMYKTSQIPRIDKFNVICKYSDLK